MLSRRAGAKRNPKVWAAVVLGCAVLTVTACSEPAEPLGPEPAPPTETRQPQTGPPIAAPTPAELNTSLVRAFDETVPAADKIELVQGAQADPQLIDQVVEAAKVNKVSAQVTDVTDLGGGTVAATVVMTLDGQPAPESIITFVAEDGVWKLSQESACGIVGTAGLSSPVCA